MVAAQWIAIISKQLQQHVPIYSFLDIAAGVAYTTRRLLTALVERCGSAVQSIAYTSSSPEQHHTQRCVTQS
jgi:hypothetical protein